MLSRFVSAIFAMAMIILFTPSHALAGGGLTQHFDRMTDVSCIDIYDCWDFSQWQGLTSLTCDTLMEKCRIQWDECQPAAGYSVMWNSDTKECDYSPVIPAELFCMTDADCAANISVEVVDDTILSATNTCHVLSSPDAPFTIGICRPKVMAVQCCAYGADETTLFCNSPTTCTTNTDCEPGVCWANKCVEKPDITEVCNKDFDCRYSQWGHFCVKSSTAGNGLCQECRPPSLTFFVTRTTIADGCDSNRRTCKWGMYAWGDIPRTTYYCE